MSKCFHHQIKKIDKEDALKSFKEFNRIKNKVCEYVLKSEDTIKFEWDCKDRLNDAFVEAFESYNDKYNFGPHFSHILKYYRLSEPPINFEKVDIKFYNKHSPEEILQHRKEVLREIVRELKPRRKIYFCLCYRIKFDECKDSLEENTNRILDNEKGIITYETIGKHYTAIKGEVNKKLPTRQSVQNVLKHTTERVEKEMLKRIKNTELE